MNTLLDDGGEIRAERFNETIPRPKMPEPPSLAPRIRKTDSAHLAVKRAATWRQERVATAAYFIAERRGFAPGHEDEDWRLAEAQIDASDAAI